MSNFYRQAHYTISVKQQSELPNNTEIEIAFVGRSNAGKSSAINAITGIKFLARTSKAPGCTKMINFFSLDERRYLIDLPGYGYANVPKKIKILWHQNLAKYLETRQSLRGMMLVIDIRHPIKKSDIQMIAWANHVDLPIHILLTKSDKLKNGAAISNLHIMNASLKKSHLTASMQLFSSLRNIGRNNAIKKLDLWLL
ncbi:MAG: YihA family ribosome biogenesis GTP-binding protein [Piscirickettsiaceae bacterium]|nr:YihA family ribosome biogenesis GTP-binding protein [Piscirickettsiaceae bacterium]